MTDPSRQKRDKSIFLTCLFKSAGVNGLTNKEKQEMMKQEWQ